MAAGPFFARTVIFPAGSARSSARRNGSDMTASPIQFGATTSRPPGFAMLPGGRGRLRLPAVVDPEPRRRVLPDRRLGHGHVTRGRAAHALTPVDGGVAEFFREDRRLERQAVATVPFGPREDRDDCRPRLQLKESERGRRRGGAPEERDEDGLA